LAGRHKYCVDKNRRASIFIAAAGEGVKFILLPGVVGRGGLSSMEKKGGGGDSGGGRGRGRGEREFF
jgi:hypothetical protein